MQNLLKMRSSRSSVYTAPTISPSWSSAPRSSSASNSGGSWFRTTADACRVARGPAGLQAQEHQVGALGLFPAQDLRLFLDAVGRVAPAGGIDQFHAGPGQFELHEQVIARGPRFGADQRRRRPGEGVE